MTPVTIEKECSACGAKLVVRFRRKTGMPFLGCERWPNCAYTERMPESVKLRLNGAPALPGLE